VKLDGCRRHWRHGGASGGAFPQGAKTTSQQARLLPGLEMAMSSYEIILSITEPLWNYSTSQRVVRHVVQHDGGKDRRCQLSKGAAGRNFADQIED